MKSTNWDAVAKRHEKSKNALEYMAEHPLTHEEATKQSIKLKNMALGREEILTELKALKAGQWTDKSADAIAAVLDHYLDNEIGISGIELDGAEQKYVETCECPPANQEEERMVYEAYKAGAEWMAGQGVSWEDIMTYYDGFLLYGKDERAFTMEGNFNEGDKVIVQIRKKQ